MAERLGNYTKAAITKQFSPTIHDRLQLKVSITPIFVVLVTGHGKTKAYLHRFKIMDHATRACSKGDQTTEHLINQCTLLQTQRELLKSNILKSGKWPVSKRNT